MAIELDLISNISGKNTIFTYEHTCSGDNRVLIVNIGFFPTNGDEVLSVKYAGVDMTLVDVAQLSNSVRSELWYIVAPASGDNNVVVTLSNSIKTVITSVSYTGVAQSDTIYNHRTAVGKNVTSLPFKSFSRTGGIAIGCGSVSNINAYVPTLYGSQVESWNITANGIRTQAISALGTFDNDNITIPNVLTQPSDWCIVLVGMRGA